MISDIREVFSGLKRNWRRPYFWRQQILEKIAGPLQQLTDDQDRVQVIKEDWDNLFIIDACRADIFSETVREYEIPGKLETVHSRGSASVGFLRKNFAGEQCLDTIYVTSNPFVKSELDDEQFYRVEHVWQDGWNEELETVRAEVMAEKTKEIVQNHPNKRVITHFMQPHYPFIGAKSVESDGFGLLRSKAMEGETEKEAEEDIWSKLSTNAVDEQVVWKSYQDNLRYVLSVIEELVHNIDGRTVITSDHGNSFGEKGWPLPIAVYGHPNGLRMPSLTRVPWYVCEGDRREIIEGSASSENKPTDEEQIQERLNALGYV